jgi:hypothetical protein
MTRRSLIHGLGALPAARAANDADRFRIPRQARPVAIAMWDFSWILRHHRLGEFENWDKALDELAERGYNAIRFDCMPHLIAPDAEGRVTEEYFFPKDSWKPAVWGNDYSVRIRPREALAEFLPKCYKRGISVGLATWFHGPVERFPDEAGLERAWRGTLAFLAQHRLLDRILYVDVLNEYPNFHGFKWLRDGMKARADAKKFQAEHPEVFIPDLDNLKPARYNLLQKQLYNGFITRTLNNLKKDWPRLDWFASLDSAMPLDDIDLSAFDALDYHVWFQHNGEMPRSGLSKIGNRENDLEFESSYASIRKFWGANRARMVDWIGGRIQAISQAAAKRNIPCGNTEGWGPIVWMDHPALDWEWVKESARICVELALSNRYKFICTSNFTHPQFPGLWRDVRWHREMTGLIRKGTP